MGVAFEDVEAPRRFGKPLLVTKRWNEGQKAVWKQRPVAFSRCWKNLFRKQGHILCSQPLLDFFYLWFCFALLLFWCENYMPGRSNLNIKWFNIFSFCWYFPCHTFIFTKEMFLENSVVWGGTSRFPNVKDQISWKKSQVSPF